MFRADHILRQTWRRPGTVLSSTKTSDVSMIVRAGIVRAANTVSAQAGAASDEKQGRQPDHRIWTIALSIWSAAVMTLEFSS